MQKKYHGIRGHEANQDLRCYRDVHNNVDINNQYVSYGHWNYHTRRTNERFYYVLVTKLYMLRLASHLSTHMLL